MSRRLALIALLALLPAVPAGAVSDFAFLMTMTEGTGPEVAVPWEEKALKAWTPEEGREPLRRLVKKLASDLMQVGRFSDAVLVYDRAVEMDPRDPILRYGRADAFTMSYRAPLAERDLQDARRLDRKKWFNVNRRCELLLRLEKYAEALPLCESFAKSQGPTKIGHEDLAMSYAFAGRSEEAEAALEVARTAPSMAMYDSSYSWHFLASALVSEAFVYGWGRDPDRGERAIEQALKQYPGKGELILVSGRLHLRRRAWNAALADFNEALRLEPWNLEAAMLRARAYDGLGKADLAAADRAAACSGGWSAECPKAGTGGR